VVGVRKLLAHQFSDYTRIAQRFERVFIRAWRKYFPAGANTSTRRRNQLMKCVHKLGALDRAIRALHPPPPPPPTLQERQKMMNQVRNLFWHRFFHLCIFEQQVSPHRRRVTNMVNNTASPFIARPPQSMYVQLVVRFCCCFHCLPFIPQLSPLMYICCTHMHTHCSGGHFVGHTLLYAHAYTMSSPTTNKS
jgi:hypothetical protein